MLVGCEKRQATDKAQLHTAVAASKLSTVHFYYSGSILPLHSANVISPVDGMVKKNHFRYGGEVAAKQLLVEIGSAKVKQDYATALTNYIKDKDQYLRGKSSIEATTALYNANVVGKESYLNEKSQFQTSQLAYVNSTNVLKELLPLLASKGETIDTLTLGDIKDIQQMLAKIPDEFKLYAPINGIVLAPLKSGTGDAASGLDKLLSEGSEVKKYQTLVSLGDMAGISTLINVSEMDVNQIALQQPATLTSPALPGMIFHGKVGEISQQAKSGEAGSGLATFPVKISVTEITPMQRRLIRVGMTLKVDIALNNQAQIKIPIKAVVEENGEYLVDVVDAKTKQIQAISVETGATDLSDVVILKGVKAGDQVVVHD